MLRARKMNVTMKVRGCVFCILILIYASTAETEVGKQYEYEFGNGTGDEFYNKEGSLFNPETEVIIPVPTSIKDTYIKVLVTSKDAPKVNTTFGTPVITLTIAFDRNQLPGGFYNITAKGIKKKESDAAVTANREAQSSTIAVDEAKEASNLDQSAAANNTTAAP